MPATLNYPGVYVEEIPSGVHTITGVATSITAFVGAALRGPADLPISCFSYADFERTFGGMTADVLDGTTVPRYSLAFAVNDFFLNGGSQAVIVRVAPAAGDPPLAAGDPNPTAAAAAQIPLGGAMTLAAASSGGWGNNLTAVVDLDTKPIDSKGTKNPDLFNLTVQEKLPGAQQPSAQEIFYNLSIKPSDPTYVVSYLEQNSQLVAVEGGAVPTSTPAAGTYPATAKSGVDGSAVTEVQIFDAGLKAGRRGIYALDRTDIFNILVIPPYKVMELVDVEALVTNAAPYCVSRRAFLLVDPPDSWDRDPNPSEAFANTIALDFTAIRTAAGEGTGYSAIFYPRIRKPNPMMGNQIQPFAVSGTLAGIFARTDTQRGVWKAPAGIDATLGGATGLTVLLSDGNNGLFNPIGINCLRTFPIIGSVVWGSRTLKGADVLSDDYKYIPVRRFALYLEESLYRGTQWCVFEPNDEPLWSQIRLSVGAFMQTLFRQGAFEGSTATKAYFVKCDDETTTQTDINNGIVNIIVGFAPLKPAEFVVLKIQQMAGTIQT